MRLGELIDNIGASQMIDITLADREPVIPVYRGTAILCPYSSSGTFEPRIRDMQVMTITTEDGAIAIDIVEGATD